VIVAQCAGEKTASIPEAAGTTNLPPTFAGRAYVGAILSLHRVTLRDEFARPQKWTQKHNQCSQWHQCKNPREKRRAEAQHQFFRPARYDDGLEGEIRRIYFGVNSINSCAPVVIIIVGDDKYATRRGRQSED
jgi:hypothetical protein